MMEAHRAVKITCESDHPQERVLFHQNVIKAHLKQDRVFFHRKKARVQMKQAMCVFCLLSQIEFTYYLSPGVPKLEFGVEPFCPLREGVNEKKTFSFGHCPNHLTPPPPDPNLGNLVLFFWTSKFKI